MVVKRPIETVFSNANTMETAIASTENLVAIVREVRRRSGDGGGEGREGKGLKKLVVDWSRGAGQMADEQAAVIEKACRELAVEFTREADF